MSTQNGFHTSFFVPDVTDYIEAYKAEEILEEMDNQAFIKASDKPDQYLLNISIEALRQGVYDYRESRMKVMEQMLANGYTLESSGSYYDEETFFVHHSVKDDWDTGFWDEALSKHLIVKF